MQRIFINGAWIDACSSASRRIINPATLEPLGDVPDCGEEDVRRAVAAAQAAQAGWGKVPGTERAGLLLEIAARIRRREIELAKLMTLETGYPLCESVDSIDRAASCFEYHAEAGRSSRHDGHSTGVVAAIAPFDFPLWTAAQVAAAIAAGNAVICKPPHHNPLVNLKLAEIYALLPPGAVNVVTGAAATGMALAGHPGVDRVACAGSTQVGREIAAAAGARGKKVDIQPRSIGAIIVLKDADLEIALPGVAWQRLRHGGQHCVSNTRIYVEKSCAAEFADRIHEYIAFLEVGDPMKPDTDLGPLISFEAARRLEGQVAHALKDGARLKLGGRCFRPWGLPGHFFQPTILTDVRHGSLAAREEFSGPVLSITPVADTAEAIRLANDYGCGLSASIYTSTPRVAAQALESLRPGPQPGTMRPQFEHVVTRKPWWFPYRDRKLASGSPQL